MNFRWRKSEGRALQQCGALSLGAVFLILGACSDLAKLPIEVGYGPQPALPPPSKSLIPTVNIAPAKGWNAGLQPLTIAGTSVGAFAAGLEHPRWLYVLPNGDVLVAESNAPPKAQANKGIKAWVMGLVMSAAGAAVPSPNRITLLRDTNGDGVADVRSVFLSGLNSPFGMALVGNELYVANTDAVLRFLTPRVIHRSKWRAENYWIYQPVLSTTIGQKISSPAPMPANCM